MHRLHEERHQHLGIRLVGREVAHHVFQAVVDVHFRTQIGDGEMPARDLIRVVHRQYIHKAARVVVFHRQNGGICRGSQIPVGEHNALCRTGRAGGEEERTHLFAVDLHI